MIYQIVFNVSRPIHNDIRDEEEISREFMLVMEGDLFEKENRFQTHNNCWFVNSILPASDIYSLMNPNENINVLISQINHNISGHTYSSFWVWLKNKMKIPEEMSDNTNK